MFSLASCGDEKCSGSSLFGTGGVLKHVTSSHKFTSLMSTFGVHTDLPIYLQRAQFDVSQSQNAMDMGCLQQ
eukprot:13015358-Ditylum_brightwellii.AAC.1